MDLEALILLGLQQPDQPGALHQLDGVVGEPAELLGLRGLFAQLIGHGHYPVQYPVAHIVVLTCGCLVMVYRSPDPSQSKSR